MQDEYKLSPGDRGKFYLAIILLVAMMATKRDYRESQVVTWWGTLYPQYCYSQVKDIPDNQGEDVKVKLGFRWLHLP